MKKGAIFMSIGRGATIKEDEMIECLKDGTLVGALLDVFREEPLS